MLYSINNLIKENNYMTNIDPSIVKVENDYTAFILNTLHETNKQYNHSLQQLYININEAVSADTFIRSNTIIIESFISNLRQMKIMFKKQIESFFKNNGDEISHIKNSKNKISKLSSNSIKIHGYLYTEDLQPDVYVVNEFLDNLIDVFDTDIVEVYENLKGSLSGGYYDELRQAILNTKNPVLGKEYNSRVYEYFRNNQNDVDDIRIGTPYLLSFINNLTKDFYINNVNEFIDDIIDQFKEVINILDRFTKSKQIDTKGDLLDVVKPALKKKSAMLSLYDESEEISEQFNHYLFLILKIKTQQVIKMIEIYGTLVSSKINAINEAITQNKIICTMALDYIENTK